MKIEIWDSWNGKFTSSIREHWESLGHQVQFNGLNYKATDPADVAFWYQGDSATQVGVSESNAKRKIVQCVDIEVYANQAQNLPWEKIDGCIFMAKHIREMVDVKGTPTAMIKPGIDLEKFTLQKPREKTPVRKLVFLTGSNRIWDVKRLDIAFNLLYDARKLKPENIWQLHIRGTYSSHEQYNAYCRHLQKDLKLDDFVVWYEERVEDLNEWLEDKDFLVLPSTKEAFSYATGEAMAKGIKPVINNWQSSKETWGQFVSNSYMEMLEKLVEEEYNPQEYRTFVEVNFNQKDYFKKLDQAILGVI